MKFGNVDNPEDIEFTLPADHPDTKRVLATNKAPLQTVSVGCAKWNKSDLKGFYPKGTKDELSYYATQFNSIELNATFYNLYKEDQILSWKERTPADFKFFPKLPRYVSHIKRLQEGYQDYLNDYLVGIQAFGDQLGMLFLQLHDNFGPKKENIDRLKAFIDQFPKDLPLAVELRHKDWFNNSEIAEDIYHFFEQNNITNVLVDSAGRRDIMHMRLTTPTAFVRYVGANHESDYTRLDEWVERIEEWKAQGLKNLYFFIHQNIEKASPLLATHFIQKLNEAIGTAIKVPQVPEGKQVGLEF